MGTGGFTNPRRPMRDDGTSGKSCHRPMNSRALVIAVLLLGVVAAGFPVDAQQTPKIPRIGYLAAGTRASLGDTTDSFRQGLRELGYVEGKTIVLDIRF